MIRRFAHLLILLAFAWPVGRAGADSITLRRDVVIEPGVAVRLSDIADLVGPRAEALAGVVIAADTAELPRDTVRGARRLDLSVIRERLKSAPGVNWALITLRGSSVRIRPPGHESIKATPTQAPRRPENEPPQAIIPGTIRALARDVLLDILKVPAADLRVRWPKRQDAFLDEPVAGRTVHVQPIGRSSRLPLSVTVYDGDRIVRTETVRASIAVRREASVVSAAVRRGTPLTGENTNRRVLWLDPGISPAADAIGKVTSRRLEPGSVIETGDVQPPLVVDRGEIVSLHCVAGAVMLRCEARALQPGRDGEVIRLEMLTSHEKVSARMSGKGRAVMVVPPAEPRAKREEQGKGTG